MSRKSAPGGRVNAHFMGKKAALFAVFVFFGLALGGVRAEQTAAVLENTAYCAENCYTVYEVCSELDAKDWTYSVKFVTPEKETKDLKKSKIDVKEKTKDKCYKINVTGTKSAFENIDNIITVNGIEYPQFVWWNSSYIHNVRVNFSVSSGTTNSDYSVENFIINTTNAPPSWNWTNECVGGTDSRVRFVSADDGVTVLGYYVAGCVAGAYVNYTLNIGQNITTDDDDASVFIYYGFSGGPVGSDPDKTYLFWDQFTGSGAGTTPGKGLNTSRWNQTYDRDNTTIENSLYLEQDAAAIDTDAEAWCTYKLFGYPVTAEFNARTRYQSTYTFNIYLDNWFHVDPYTSFSEKMSGHATHTISKWTVYGAAAGAAQNLVTDTWYKIGYSANATSTWISTNVSGTYGRITAFYVLNETTPTPFCPMAYYPGGGWSASKWELDNLKIRRPHYGAADVEITPIWFFGTESNITIAPESTINFTVNYPASAVEDTAQTVNVTVSANETYYTAISAILNWNGTLFYPDSKTTSGTNVTFSYMFTTPYIPYTIVPVVFSVNVTMNYTNATTINVTTGPYTQMGYMLYLSNCSAPYTEKTLWFYFRDEDTESYINGSLDITLDVQRNGFYPRNYSFVFSGTTNYSICISPNTTALYTNSMAQYYYAGYDPRTHYLINSSLTNTTQTINLYLKSNTTTSLIEIQVLNSLGLPEPDVYIFVERYYIGTNTYAAATILKTDYDGKTAAYLEKFSAWYRFILMSSDGEILEQYAPMVITEDSLIFRLTEAELGEFFNYYGRVAYNCTFPSNTTTCTVLDTSGLMSASSLKVYRWSSLGYITVCEMESTSSSVTHVCALGSTAGKIFYYSLESTYSYSNMTLESGYLDYRTGTPAYGDLGVLVTIMLVMVLVFVGAYRWEISLVLAGVGIALSWVGGLLYITAGSVMAFFVVIAIAIYKARSR